MSNVVAILEPKVFWCVVLLCIAMAMASLIVIIHLPLLLMCNDVVTILEEKGRCDQNICSNFCCVNKAHLVVGWKNNLVDELLHKFGLVEVPRQKMVCNHKTWNKSQCFRFYYLLFLMFFVVYMLWIPVCTLQILDSAQCWSIGPLHGFFMYGFGGSANGEYKEGAFDDGKLSFEIRTQVVFLKCVLNVSQLACVGGMLFLNNRSIKSSCEGRMP